MKHRWERIFGDWTLHYERRWKCAACGLVRVKPIDAKHTHFMRDAVKVSDKPTACDMTPNVEASEPPTRGVNRDSGTGCAHGGSLR